MATGARRSGKRSGATSSIWTFPGPIIEAAQAHAGVMLDAALHSRLVDWAQRHYREQLGADELADPQLVEEVRVALDELAVLLGLGTGFYPFQRAHDHVNAC